MVAIIVAMTVVTVPFPVIVTSSVIVVPSPVVVVAPAIVFVASAIVFVASALILVASALLLVTSAIVPATTGLLLRTVNARASQSSAETSGEPLPHRTTPLHVHNQCAAVQTVLAQSLSLMNRRHSYRVSGLHIVFVCVLHKSVSARLAFQVMDHYQVLDRTVLLAQIAKTTLWGQVVQIGDEQGVHRVLRRLRIGVRIVYVRGWKRHYTAQSSPPVPPCASPFSLASPTCACPPSLSALPWAHSRSLAATRHSPPAIHLRCKRILTSLKTLPRPVIGSGWGLSRVSKDSK